MLDGSSMPNQQQDFPQSTRPKKSVLKIVLIILGVLLLLGAGAVGGYYYFKHKSPKTTTTSSNPTPTPASSSGSSSLPSASNQTTDPTANWNTYNNDKFGYTIKYPTNFYYIDYLYDKIAKQRVNNQEWLFIDKNPLPENAYLSGADFPQPYFKIVSISKNDLVRIKTETTGATVSDITFAGEAAVKVVTTEPIALDGSFAGTIYVNHGSNGYIISWRNSDANGTHDTEVDQMLSSFRFTN